MSTAPMLPRTSKTFRPSSDSSVPASGSLGCQRCGGLLVDEHCMDIGDEGSGHRFWGMRCIQCGDVIDETILRNRFSSIETLKKLRSRTRSRAIVQSMAGYVREGTICHSL